MLLEDGHCFKDQALALCHREGIGVEDEFRATSLETLHSSGAKHHRKIMSLNRYLILQKV